eukprot:TRINITY_DN154_c0_g3_i3.p1 TRINITY_DN154_c0_g3~~TRINITY_DN154_c0_g3_i3.p1  ORF type:complete len:214 (+),score=64.14 TRINITY_DN154_c0_g3_i3:58-699(+)
MDTLQKSYQEGGESAKKALVEIQVQLEGMLVRLSELVEQARKEGGEKFEESKVALTTAKGRVQELITKCEAVLRELLIKAKTYYEESTTPEQKEWVETVLNKSREQFTSASQKFGTHNEKVTSKLLKWKDDVQSTVADLSKTHVAPTLTTAKEQLNNYSPSSYEKAGSAISSLTDPSLSFFQKIYSFVFLILQALWVLLTTPFKKAEPELKEE